jgi:transcriptional regulator with XRE-family HTH domain
MLYEALRMMRVYHDMTQTELADRLGISKSHLSEVERGKKAPTVALLEKYAKIFGVPVSSIMFFSENMTGNKALDKAKTLVSSKILALMRFIAERSSEKHAD